MGLNGKLFRLDGPGFGMMNCFRGPALFSVKKSFQEFVVEGMARLFSHDVSQDGHPEQGKIPYTIQDFMTDKLIRISEAVRVDDIVFIHDQDIVKGPPLGQPVVFHQFVFFQKPESSGPGYPG